MDERDIRAVQARTRRYWFEDGVVELLLGVLLLIWAGGELAPPFLKRYVLGIIIPVLGVTLAFTQTRFLTWIKSRTTFPRTGYAEPKRMDRPRWIAAGLMAVGMVALIFAGGVAGRGGWEDAPTALTALTLSGGFVVIGAWQGVRRISWLGVWGLVAALALTRAGFTGDRLSGVHALALGAAALLSGGITLALFLKRTRPTGEG